MGFEARRAAPPSIAEPEEGRAGRLLTAAAWATLSIVAWETWSTCRALVELRFTLLVQCFALNLAAALVHFAPTLLLVLLLALLAEVPALRARVGRARSVLELAAGAGAVLEAYRTLALYPPFAAAHAARLAYLAVCAYAAGACWLGGARSAARLAGRAAVWRGVLSRAAMSLGVVGALGALWLHATLYVKEYPSLHSSLVQLAHLLAVLGLWLALERPWAHARRLSRAAWLSPVVACALLLAFHAAGLSASARPQYRSASVFGLAEALFEPYSEAREVPEQPVADTPDALRRLRELARLPELPEGFDLQRYDVLLVMSESTRFDQTSLGNPALGTTPQLSLLQEQGAFSFARAYSPSSATLLALAGILGMSYPSLIALDTWNKPWTGQLLESAETAAESFRAGGYDTFWIGHDHRGSFSHALLGLDAGFAERTLLTGDERTDTTIDAAIADRAIAALAAHAGSERRFFGFVFFVSPHYPYLTHDPTRPHQTELERYRQELQATDEQLGRVLQAVDASPLKERTLVIFMGDHGEEFGEHGGRQHHSSLYVESLHVPLVVRIPGVAGQRWAAPMSSAYVLPWLLSHGSAAQRASLARRLAHELGPMLEATDGAVIAELLGHDRVKSTLIYGDMAFIYDFFADRSEAYQFADDPGQSRDLFGIEPGISARALEQIGAYKNVRAARRRFRLRPDILDPRNAR